MGITLCKSRKPTDAYRQHDLTPSENLSSSPPVVKSAINVDPEPEIIVRDVKSQATFSALIDKSLKRQKSEDLSRVKILLLGKPVEAAFKRSGGADAGKSTILNQMRILHMDGFSVVEMHNFHKYLRFNLLAIFQAIASGVHECNLDIEDQEMIIISQVAEGMFLPTGIGEENEVEVLNSFLDLKCVRSFTLLYPNYSNLPDNAHYYLPKLAQLLSNDYVPSAEDILHLRIPTTAVNEINFSFDSTSIRLIDVGGQRTYLKKWIHCFDGVAAVLFVASMAAYDQRLDEVDILPKPVQNKDLFVPTEVQLPAKLPNRLRDSAQLFGEMLRNEFLKSSSFILFLNKKDLFWKKLLTHPLEKHFGGYNGTNKTEASEFINEYFLKRKSKKDKDRKIYSHFTCATDTKNVEFVFKAACDIVLQNNLLSSGIRAKT